MSDEKKYVDLAVGLKGVSGFTVKKKPTTTAVQVALLFDGAELELSTYHPHDLETLVPRFQSDGQMVMSAENLDFGFCEEPITIDAWGLKAAGCFISLVKFAAPITVKGNIRVPRLVMFRTQMV